jgi:AraC family transcriptional regulator
VSTVLSPVLAEEWLGEAYTPLDPEQDLRLTVTDAHIVDLVRRLQAQAQGGQPWGALYVEGLSLALASYVYARYSRRAPLDVARDAELSSGLRDYARPANTNGIALRGGGMGLTHAQCDRLISFIEENLSRSISLGDLAELVRYSTDHFARLFKRSFGVPAHQYVLERRIERAKSLLRDRRRSMLEVALACGFSSQAHFNFAFKRRVGVTPGIYRKG